MISNTQNLKKISFLILILIFLTNFALAQTKTSAGFIPGNIWYSKEPFEEGDKIKIYTLVFNPELKELSGTVMFFDNETLLGQKNFSILAGGLKDVSINWTVNVGAHTIFARIQNAKFLLPNGESENVTLKDSETEKSVQLVKQKIIPKVTDSVSTDQSPSSSSNSIENVAKLIQEKTPSFVAQPLIYLANQTEGLRNNLAETTENKKNEVKEEILELKDPTSNLKANYESEVEKNISGTKEISADETLLKAGKETVSNQMEKPLKYLELFFLQLGSLIFKTAILFYGLALLILFFILRFLWRKIF